MYRTAIVVASLLLLLMVGPPQHTHGQANPPAVSMAVSGGYDGLFRENHWLPLLVRVSNEGGSVNGRLIVRPETSGNALANAYSTPIDLPTGSRKSVFLYMTARSFANQVRVELLDENGFVITSEPVRLQGVLLQDQLHVVVTQASAGSVDLTQIHAGGYNAFQANWLPDNLPDNVMALDAIDTLLFSDVDTGTLSSEQRRALGQWVAQGGHLIVTGGTNWQAAAAGLSDLLPLQPDGSDTVGDLNTLVDLAGLAGETLTGDTIAVTGELTPDAQVLAATPDDVPLVVRRSSGLGTVDYLTVDPLANPLRNWSGMNEVWFTLVASVQPHPAWSHGFINQDRAAAAVEIFPGYNLLPDILPLCGFLVFYVILIGPVNYAILNRINRREWAWITIPLLIGVFSVMAWVIGFNLRGNTAVVNRMAVIQSWVDEPDAQVQGLVGLLSPRRTTYTLSMEDAGFLRPISHTGQVSPFSRGGQANTNIEQADAFRAVDFPVDASFVATFGTMSAIERPEISGQVSMVYGSEGGVPTLRGSVRNDSAFTLSDAVILAEGVVLPLTEPLEPGDIETFTTAPEPGTLDTPAPSVLERSLQIPTGRLSFRSSYRREEQFTDRTVRDILGTGFDDRAYFAQSADIASSQELQRRQLFLSAFSIDQYLSTGRGSGVYLVGWAQASPLEMDLLNTAWEAVDLSLFIIELDTSVEGRAGDISIPANHFTWVAEERASLSTELAPANLVLQAGEAVTYRFTPVPDARLREVESLRLYLLVPGTLRSPIPIELWNWDTGEWVVFEMTAAAEGDSFSQRIVEEPGALVGPNNAVRVRVTAGDAGSFLRLLRLTVEQVGRF